MKKFILIVFGLFILTLTVTAFTTSPKMDEPCRSCNGRGWNRCTMCDGNGWRECSFCDGNGYIVLRDGTKETCENCRGKKGFKCGYCDNGHRECSACYGTGKQRYIGQ